MPIRRIAGCAGAFGTRALGALSRAFLRDVQAEILPNDKEAGLAQMSEKFRQRGEQVYLDADKVKESTKARCERCRP
jgi:hypothetical protein